MLVVADLEKRYGDVVALAGVDLSVQAGQVVALLGRNGAGKTTLLSIVAGLLRPDAGSVTIDGADVLAHPDLLSATVGIAPQETGIYRVLTVRENLEFFAELTGCGRRHRRQRAEAAAEQLGLMHLLDRRATALSGGEARRLHTACALVHQPRLLLLDEPTVGADVATRHQLIDGVRRLTENGTAIVYTTHYLPEVEALDADVVIIDEGRMLARGTQSELVARHFEPSVVLRFAHPVEVPDAVGPVVGDDDRSGRVWQIPGRIDLVDVVARLGPVADQLVAVEAAQPDLEQVFLTVTGRSLAGDTVGEETVR